jgi:hypothetical protein
MASSFPSMNVIRLRYVITVPGHTVGLASTIPSTIDLVEYAFGSAADYASFDQAATEAVVATALTTVASSWGTLLGVDPSVFLAGLVISRNWVFAGPDFTSSQIEYADTMTYPPE